MTDPKTTEEMDAYVGKIFEQDFTRDDIEQEFPNYNIFISRLGALAIANLRTDRLRVWLDEENKVVKVITG